MGKYFTLSEFFLIYKINTNGKRIIFLEIISFSLILGILSFVKIS